MGQFYSNENFDYQVVMLLRAFGYDVLTSQEAGRANQRISDQEVLEFATSQNRAVLTFNRKDFFKLHQLMPDHAGIIACTYDTDYERIAKRIHEVIQKKNEELRGELIRIYRPNT
ncbi:MAG: DUF5615 family PIN-like protein [Saprospiraceae bacterium]|nr:DUF5615 family PIN-like protein [Saprospiraceae bacterium]